MAETIGKGHGSDNFPSILHGKNPIIVILQPENVTSNDIQLSGNLFYLDTNSYAYP